MAEYGYHAPRHAQTWPQIPPPPEYVQMPDVDYQYDNGAALGLYRDLGDIENDEYVEFRQPADYEYMDALPPRRASFYPPPPLNTGYTHTPYSSENVPYTSSPPPLTRCDSAPTSPQTPQTPYYGFPPSAEPCIELGDTHSYDPASPQSSQSPYEFNYGFPFSAEPLAELDYTPTYSPPSTPDLAELQSDCILGGLYQPVRLLYRSITGESRTMSRTTAGLAPAALLFQHWAVEVGPLASGHRFELEYVGRSQLRYTPPSSTASFANDRANYYHAPKGFRGMSSGFTQMKAEEIRRIAEGLMQERYREYKLGSTDCRNFALELLGRICRGNTGARAKALMGMDKVVRKGVEPVGKVGTRSLRKMGLLGDGGCW